MKTTPQIAVDCGIAGNLATEFFGIIHKTSPPFANEYEQGMHEIIAALYRRIEKLEEEKKEVENTLYRALFPHPSAHEVRMYGAKILAGREVK